MLETSRILLREFHEDDLEGMFALHSNPDVHVYLGNKTINTRDEAAALIAYIQQQYRDFGIGRWACVEKSSNQFMGWCGLKFVTEIENNQSHFHDIGYRFLPQFWNQGYAKEAAKPCVEYGFNSLNLEKIIGTCHIKNIASYKVLQHCGLTQTATFEWGNLPCRWMEITRNHQINQ
jgi:RimJ/RimL family protein N-acetyltransferase